MNIETFIQELTAAGLALGISPDGERITVDTTRTKLTDEQKTLIREHKAEIMDFLAKRDLNPKVVKGAMTWMIYRSQTHLNRLTLQERSTLMDSLSEYRQTVWELYTSLLDLSQKPYTSSNQKQGLYREKLILMRKLMLKYYHAVRDSVATVIKTRPSIETTHSV